MQIAAANMLKKNASSNGGALKIAEWNIDNNFDNIEHQWAQITA